MKLGVARPWAIMALIFALGGVTGSLLTIGLGPHFPSRLGPQEIRAHWMHHLVWRLHLTDAQVAKIEPIVSEAETRIQSAHREDVARIFGIMQQANASMQPFLDADQQATLAKMEREREKIFNERLHGALPHGPLDGAEGEDHSPDPPPPPSPEPGA